MNNKQKLINQLKDIVNNLSFIALFNGLSKNSDKVITDSILNVADKLCVIIKELKKEQRENDKTRRTK